MQTRPDDVPPRPQPRVPAWPAILLLGLGAGLVAFYGSALMHRDCTGVGDCLSWGFAGLIFIWGAAPLLVMLGMAVLRFPRGDLLAPLLMALVVPLWQGSVEKLTGIDGPSWAWLWVPINIAMVASTWLLARSRPTPWYLRAGGVLLVIGIGVVLNLLA